jgi:hypothetical protein
MNLFGNALVYALRCAAVLGATFAVGTHAAVSSSDEPVKLFCKWDYCRSDNPDCGMILSIIDKSGTVSHVDFDTGKTFPIRNAQLNTNEIKWNEPGYAILRDESGEISHQNYFVISRLSGKIYRYSIFNVGNEKFTYDEMNQRMLDGIKSGKNLAIPAMSGIDQKGECQAYTRRF